jgi:hypothetical protein
MKIRIGPYKNWIGPFQIASALCFWAKKEKDEYGFKSEPDWVHNFGTWLAGGEEKESLLMKFCLWVESKRTRTIKVKIHNYDTWSMDHTLAHIILPMLKQLKETKNGGPFVDDADVPEELRSNSAPPKENEYDVDDNHFKRWDYVLDEMIFSFEHKLDDSWEDAFRKGEMDLVWDPVDNEGNSVPKEEAKFFRMNDGPNHTYECDYEGMKKVQQRISNGFRLFGVYYENLWD